MTVETLAQALPDRVPRSLGEQKALTEARIAFRQAQRAYDLLGRSVLESRGIPRETAFVVALLRIPEPDPGATE
jgi:hypothetical protein